MSRATVVAGGYAQGFQTLTAETVVDRLPVHGRLPGWLAGTLVRNGPALFDGKDRAVRHWFDGQAMLHAFSFADGGVGYRNRLLDTPASRAMADDGRISYAEFATDPCGSLFQRFFTRFSRKPTPNACVNVLPGDGNWLAVSETPLAVRFDPETLAAGGVVDRASSGATLTTAHPHLQPGTGNLIDYTLNLSRVSSYAVTRQSAADGPRQAIAKIAAERPGYVHSFGISPRYVALAVFPLVVNPLSFILRGRPFIENYKWRPELGTRLFVVDLVEERVQGQYELPPFFAFHHVNSWEDGNTLVMDVCAYDDAGVVDALYLDNLRRQAAVPMAQLRRYRVDLRTGRSGTEVLADEPLELPRIAYSGFNGRRYRYAYGVSAREGRTDDFLNQLAKVDVETGDTRRWSEPGCYPGEPVFVAAPGATAEDDGVVLSVVLDTRDQRSFLLVLDAAAFGEVARAATPHAIPFGFHGQFRRPNDPSAPAGKPGEE